MSAPQNPAGEYVSNVDPAHRPELIRTIAETPQRLRAAVAALTDQHLETKYRNWTIRQIVHHLPDSHVNAYIRFKTALAEPMPTIRPYDESAWSALPNNRLDPIEPSLALMDAIHRSWVDVLKRMTPTDFEREYFHPEQGKNVSLAEALCSYAWHANHHIAQIEWLRRHG